MVISYHYPGRNGRIRFYPQEEKSEYCRLIQSSQEGKRRYLQCDREGLETARRKNSFHIYRCHAGLMDVAIPLMYKGTEIGSIYTGQVLLEPQSSNDLRNVVNDLSALNISRERLTRAYAKIKSVSRDHLLFYAKLLHLFGNYILLMENELYLERMVVLKSRELHRKEIERIELEKTLKELTISVLESDKSIRPLTFRSYLVRKRIDAAKTLLRNSDLPIKEIVFRTGFKDYNYFNRTFTGMEGITPARFRSANGDRASNPTASGG